MPRRAARAAGLPLRRRVAGWLVLAVGVPALTVVFVTIDNSNLAVDLLLYLAVVLAAGGVGGLGPGIAGALTSATAANYYLIPPVHRLTIAKTTDVVALVVFLAVAVTVSTLVNRSARLTHEAANARALEQADAMRTAILQAASHDLRTPLAGIKAAVTSLLGDEVVWPPEAVRQFQVTIDAEADRLDRLVGNLLDMSRLQAGAVQLHLGPVALEDIVGAALGAIDQNAALHVDIPDSTPFAHGDPALVERVVANLIANAVAHTPSGQRVLIQGDGNRDEAILRIVDHGPGVSPTQIAHITEPFQRLGDTTTRPGVGLGLAVANGFTAAMGGRLAFSETPGGGLTAAMILPAHRNGRSAGPGT